MFSNIIQAALCVVILLLLQSSLFAETKLETATFAGGCFWCMESPFEKLEGVKGGYIRLHGRQEGKPDL